MKTLLNPRSSQRLLRNFVLIITILPAALVASALGGATVEGSDAMNPTGLLGRFVRNADLVPGSFWPPQTQAGILAIHTYDGPGTVEKLLTGPLSFGPQHAADQTITDFFGGVPTEPNQFAIGFFGYFTAPVSGLFQMQVALVDDNAGFWVDLDGNGIFQTAGANGNELISQRNCCGDGNVGSVQLEFGHTYKVGIAVEDGQGGSSMVARIGLPGAASLSVVDPNSVAQAGWWIVPEPGAFSLLLAGTLGSISRRQRSTRA